MIPFTIGFGAWAPDWAAFEELPARLSNRTVYDPDATIFFAWSPVAAVIMAGVTLIGYWPWVAVHVGALAFLRSMPLVMVLALSSWAFWIDTASGNTMTFVFVSGALALSGSRPAAIVNVALFILMPRPVHLPLVALLLWKDRSLWRPALAIFAVHAAAVLVSGYAMDWVTSTVEYAGDFDKSLGPTRYVGTAWLVVGIPLGCLLAWKGRVGWAGLAMTPYLLAQYLLLPLWELVPRSRSSLRR